MSEIKWVRACDGLLVRLDRVVAVKAAPNGAVVHLSTGQRLETTARVEDIAMQITDASADDRTRRKRAEWNRLTDDMTERIAERAAEILNDG